MFKSYVLRRLLINNWFDFSLSTFAGAASRAYKGGVLCYKNHRVPYLHPTPSLRPRWSPIPEQHKMWPLIILIST